MTLVVIAIELRTLPSISLLQLYNCDKLQQTMSCVYMQIVMDWLGKLLSLPQQFLSRTAEGSLAAGGGVIQGSASEATLVCMLAARARAMTGRPVNDMAKVVAYTSDQVTTSASLLSSSKLTCTSSGRRLGAHKLCQVCASDVLEKPLH